MNSTAKLPWLPAEDGYLQTHWLTPLPVQAAVLGRTIKQVQQRRQRLLGNAAGRLLDAPRRRAKSAAIVRGHALSDCLNRIKG
jgi:hypothetical protein